MKVEVRSKEIVRPSSPTPESLKNYKLSFVDQIALNVKIPFIFFYSSAISGASHHTIDGLKKSLSKTLSLMYPLAGRVKEDKLTIECNDEGAEFIVADVAGNMSGFLENPEMEKIKHLIPTAKLYEPRPVGKVNRFICGGMAIGFVVSHAIADGSAIATFFETWASINRDGAVNRSELISDQPSILFPPLPDISALERSVKMVAEAAEKEEKNNVTKRFVIPANAVAKLRQELTVKDGNGERPSRTEALTALVWAAVINSTIKTQTVNSHRVSCMVNLRSRMEPPLPSNCLGSLAYGATANWEAGKQGTVVTAAELVHRIRDCVRTVNDGVARKMYGEDGLFRAVFARGEVVVRRNEDCPTLYTSSLCRLPYYEVDFGWGKPRLVVNVVKNSTVHFLDGVNGAVELWIGLPKEVMHSLTQNHHFLAYVSVFPKPKL